MSPISTYIINLIFVLFLVFCNAFFVISEFAVVKIRRTKLEELAHAGSKRAKIALEINEHLNTYLSATQLGITLASLGLGWLGEPAVSRLLEDVFGSFFEGQQMLLHSLSFGVAFTLITLFHVVLGELVPKSMAIQNTERYALFVAVPLYTFNKICTPIIWCFDHVSMWILKLMKVQKADENEDAHSEEEIKLIIDASQKGGVIDDTESEIIQNAINFSEIFAHEIMVPRQDMKCIYKDDSFDEVMAFVRENKHTRFPLCDQDKDQILGMLHIRDLLENKDAPQKDILKRLVRKVLFVPENKSISDVLHEMMKKRIQLAIVVDEYGGTAGLLTMEDILEELVGEIQDEHDGVAEEACKCIDEKTYEFDGVYLVEDAYEEMGLPYHELEESTMGGYLFNLLGEEPNVGDKAEDENCIYEVLSVDNMRITRLRATLKNCECAPQE
ncbi:MAG: HlyC/CorC family transporter [Alphaproteobacteria bacterium]|nr:HlyC/CorC family transporter [Alphaproteobacteria bacterium]MBR1756111.1 HlyC/CorC family transporter [Alphaproteobacteria bacterium]